jgi:hypothetical protein
LLERGLMTMRMWTGGGIAFMQMACFVGALGVGPASGQELAVQGRFRARSGIRPAA